MQWPELIMGVHRPRKRRRESHTDCEHGKDILLCTAHYHRLSWRRPFLRSSRSYQQCHYHSFPVRDNQRPYADCTPPELGPKHLGLEMGHQRLDIPRRLSLTKTAFLHKSRHPLHLQRNKYWLSFAPLPSSVEPPSRTGQDILRSQ
jgi:hypothetical protein